VGKQQVREGIQSRLDGIPDVHYGDDCHWLCGDRGVSQWTLRGTQRTCEPIEVRGCDLFQFVDGKNSRKDSFWKIVDRRHLLSRDRGHVLVARSASQGETTACRPLRELRRRFR
jgi:SnoaL-like protein